jgi:hypothetical protein
LCAIGVQAPKFLNPKSQNTNIKWFDTLTTLSQPVESLKVERVEGQITMTEIQNIKPVWVIEKLRFKIYLACDELSRVEFGAWNLEFYILLFGI